MHNSFRKTITQSNSVRSKRPLGLISARGAHLLQTDGFPEMCIIIGKSAVKSFRDGELVCLLCPAPRQQHDGHRTDQME